MSLRFLDSNILLYAYSRVPAEITQRDIARSLLLQSDWCISVQVLQEFYANAIRARQGAVAMLPRTEAAIVVARLRDKVSTAVDVELVLQAIQISQRHQLSYWDGAIVAAAVRSGAQELLTEDLNAGQVIEGVRVVNPFA
jgi:predicted nucleic acid-binding protein